jgi:hypothetical protein
MEIERNPVTPKLNTKAIDLLTELCFRKDDAIKAVDGIFVFSSTHEIKKISSIINHLLANNIASKVFITGGITPALLAKNLKTPKGFAEADLLLSAIDIHKFKEVSFFVEKVSTNTLENVTETLKYPEFKSCQSLLYIFKSHAAGRGYLTLKKYLPQTKLLQRTFNAKYPGAEHVITRSNWHVFPFGRERVWGEFLRIKAYGSKGDIEYDSVKELI